MSDSGTGAIERWPALPFGDWKDTAPTLHMWTQIVGKVRLAGWDRAALERPFEHRP